MRPVRGMSSTRGLVVVVVVLLLLLLLLLLGRTRVRP